jgi:carbamoyltransferase
MNILGLSVATTEHHAAALVVGGQLVAAAEEERFNRIKHYGARPRSAPHANLINDATLSLADVLCKDAVRYVLDAGGIRLSDVDRIAVNGIPRRFADTYSATDPSRPPGVVSEGRYVFVPHHLCHAASAFRLSGMREANVLTLDGRGERETAAFFRASEDGSLVRVWDVLVGDRHSFGGCYETASRQLGFGPHGQGAVMALAALGVPRVDLTSALDVQSHADRRLDERALWRLLDAYARRPDDPIAARHRDVAASVQRALEDGAAALAREAFAEHPSRGLCLAGGVALNCPMNGHLRRVTGAAEVFVQPAAHDAGTAIGAALEVAWREGEPLAAPMRTGAWGPEFDEDAMAAALRSAGLQATRMADPPGDVAHRLADGRIVCRFSGRMEVGPRALGQRSILADPRRELLKPRLNAMKSRAEWRPFGPSIRAGAEGEWFTEAWDSPFMLFTFFVHPERQGEIPVVVHGDGSTRPQAVHPDVLPDYAALIDAFAALTGVPMVVNTSFNRGGEPIVCTPSDAIASFLGLGADSLALGPFLIDR